MNPGRIHPEAPAVGPAAGRRAFLKTGVAAGALVIGLDCFAIEPRTATLKDARGRVPMGAFIAVGRDGRVTMTIAKIEMGQGTYTAIPMLLAEELEVDMASIDIRHAPPDAAVYGLPIGDQFTGGSTSIQYMWLPMRQAGAAARTMLIQAAAARWKVAPESCHASHGVVIHAATKRSLGYGALVDDAAQLPVPTTVALKPPSEFRLVGTPVKRLDGRGKTDGSAMYGIDIVLPGMKFATVAACPTIGGTLASVDDSKALRLTGVHAVIRIENAVAVVADNMWYAKQGLAALDIQWTPGANAGLSTEMLRSRMVGALANKGAIARNDGDALKVLAADASRVDAVYVNPMLAHAAMEPLNCTIDVRDDEAEIWVGTQVPARARDAAAALLGLPAAKVTLNGFLIGGAFGRRLAHDFIDQAARFGRQWKGKGPLKIVWTREEDMQQDLYRGLYAHSLSASVDADGYPRALLHKIAGPSNLATFAPAFVKDGVDGDAVEGSVELCYDIPNMRTEFVREDGPVPTTFWRGVGPTRNALVLESFIDELAHKAGKDPVEYRLRLLQRDKRAHHVVARAATLAGWGRPMPARAGRGIALLHAWKTYLAQVVELSVDDAGGVTVKRVVCVVDCGAIVNPDTVVAQIQGGIVFGLSAALYGEITVVAGKVQQSNFSDYQVVRFNEAPNIEVELVSSTESPGGIGEPGTAGFKGAFANAIAAATGKWLRTLPPPAGLLSA